MEMNEIQKSHFYLSRILLSPDWFIPNVGLCKIHDESVMVKNHL